MFKKFVPKKFIENDVNSYFCQNIDMGIEPWKKKKDRFGFRSKTFCH